MGRVNYVGRVGALAVALGIGVAIGAAPAWAQPGESAPSDSGSKPSHSAPKGESSRGPAKRDGAAGRHRDDGADAPKARKHNSRPGTQAAGQPDATADDSDGSRRGVPDQPAATPESPAPRTVMRALSAPVSASLSGHAPAAPAESPLLWTVLASARREFDRQRTDLGRPSAMVHSAALLTAGAPGPAAVAAVTADSIPGRAAGPVIAGPAGTRYQVTYDVDPDTHLPTKTRVSILDASGAVLKTTNDIAGVPNEQARAVVRPDGSLILTTYNSAMNITTISAVDGQGTVRRVGLVFGQPSQPLSVASNGTVYLQTRQFSQSGDRLVRISTANTARVYQLGTSYGEPVVAPDGTAYLTGRSWLGSSSLLAVGPAGSARRVYLPSGAVLPNEAVIGQDGRAYFTVAARQWFGGTVTRAYVFTGTSSTMRTVAGAPQGEKVVTGDGVYQATYDAATGKTYVAKITAGALDTSDAIDGMVVTNIRVTPDGTVYAPVRNAGADSVAVVGVDGHVGSVAIPGALVLVSPAVPGTGATANPGSDNHGYVAYTSGGQTYLAVLAPNGTIARTVALPAGAVVRNPVSYAPDGTAYQVVGYLDGNGRVTSQSVLALSDDTMTPTRPGGQLLPNYPDIQFGPGGTGFLVTQESGPGVPTYHFLGFDQSGATVVSLDVSGYLQSNDVDYVYHQQPLVFAPDGTGYVTVTGPNGGVWALTASGATKVLDLAYSQTSTASAVVIAPDGTGYVTVSELVGGQYVTTAKVVPAPTVT